MSFDGIRWAFQQLANGKVPGGPATALVLLKIADRANDQGVCWPGFERLAKDVGISKRSAERAVAQIVAAGLLKRVSRTDGAGRRVTNLYHLPIPGSVKLADGGVEPSGGGVKLSGGGRQIDVAGRHGDGETSKREPVKLTHQRERGGAFSLGRAKDDDIPDWARVVRSYLEGVP